jgi:hypothetical protein
VRPPRRGALKVRPRLIASVPGGENPALTPFERFEKFARQIILVPKAEADRRRDKESASTRNSLVKDRRRQAKGGIK